MRPCFYFAAGQPTSCTYASRRGSRLFFYDPVNNTCSRQSMLPLLFQFRIKTPAIPFVASLSNHMHPSTSGRTAGGKPIVDVSILNWSQRVAYTFFHLLSPVKNDRYTKLKKCGPSPDAIWKIPIACCFNLKKKLSRQDAR